MDTIVRAMAEPDSGLDIRDRVWLKIPIPRSFLGTRENGLVLRYLLMICM